jgi:hypothetical protein
MAETLGTLCDKLVTVKLKEWHSEDPERLRHLAAQEHQLRDEIDEFVGAALAGEIPPARLTFAANKVYKKEGNDIADIRGSVGEIFALLAETNCRLWHVQEKVYEFESIPAEEKDAVVKQLAVLNLERNECIDRLDRQFLTVIEQLHAAK